MKSHGNAILAGCPLLLQLWSYERLAIGRPIVSHEPYHEAMYDDEEDDRPTMGTLWILWAENEGAEGRGGVLYLRREPANRQLVGR